MPQPPKPSASIEAAFTAFPNRHARTLKGLRRLIFDAAHNLAQEGTDIGDLQEVLRWGMPAYMATKARTGTTIRLGVEKKNADACGFYVPCSTKVMGEIKSLYGSDLTYDDNRGLLFTPGAPLPKETVRHCAELALTYHLRRRG